MGGTPRGVPEGIPEGSLGLYPGGTLERGFEETPEESHQSILEEIHGRIPEFMKEFTILRQKDPEENLKDNFGNIWEEIPRTTRYQNA